MKQEETHIVTFGKGMAETVKQDINSETGNPMSSVLWLENYNPNIESEAIVKRYGEIKKYGGGDEFALDAVSSILRAKIDDRMKWDIVIHATMFISSNPKTNENHVLFVRRFPMFHNTDPSLDNPDHMPSDHPLYSDVDFKCCEATSVYGRVIEWAYNGNASDWDLPKFREIFLEAIQPDYKGWYTLGTMMDCTRHGESLIFVTKLIGFPEKEYAMLQDPPIFSDYNKKPNLYYDYINNVAYNYTNYLYPAYVWTRWDLTKKREDGSDRFFNGITISDLDKKHAHKWSRWKVLTPEQSIVTGKCGICYVDYDSVAGANYIYKTDGTKGTFPISLVFWNQPIKSTEVSSDANTPILNNVKVEPYFKDKKIEQVSHARAKDMICMRDDVYFVSHETINNGRLDSLCMAKYHYETPCGGVGADHAAEDLIDNQEWKGIVCLGENTVGLEDETWNMRQKQGKPIRYGNNRDTNYIDNAEWDRTGGTYHANHKDGTKISVGTYVPVYKEEYITKTGQKFKVYIGGWGKTNQNPGITGEYDDCWVPIPTIFPDYISSNIPRPWFKEDKIPIIITGVVNGVEVLLCQEIFSVPYQDTFYPADSWCQWSVESWQGNGPSWYTPHNEFYSPIRFATLGAQSVIAGPAAGYRKDKGTSKYGEYLAPLLLNGNGKDFNNYIDIYDYGWGMYDASPFNMLKSYNNLMFTIRLSPEAINMVYDMDITSIKVYVSRPDTEKDGYLRSVTAGFIKPTGSYCYPAVNGFDKEIDLQNYGLVKEFMISGKGRVVADYSQKIHEDFIDSNTNGWYDTTEDIAFEGSARWAIPQEDTTKPLTAGKYPNTRTGVVTTNGGVGGFDPSLCLVNEEFSDHIDNFWTPDFILWDYPTDSSPMSLEFSGKYWTGKGARLVAVIKGRVFILGTIDSEGVEEQGIVRYSMVQKGVISKTLFDKEAKIRIGHLPHSAVFEFREQLVVFSRQSNYRMLLPNILDESSWEILDAQTGNGTFSQKTVCVTPHGYVYGNEQGIWLSDGRMPQSLSDNYDKGLLLTGLWQKLATNKPYAYQNLIDPGEVYINDEGFNPYMEFHYEEVSNELIITTPTNRYHGTITDPWINQVLTDSNHVDHYEYNLDTEIRMIYNFDRNNWRIESYIMRRHSDKTYSKLHKVHYVRSELHTLRLGYPSLQEGGPTSIVDTDQVYMETFEIAVKDRNALYDFYGSSDTDNIQYNGLLYANVVPIVGEIITHEIGNGKDDYLLSRMIIEGSPKETIRNNGNIIKTFGWQDYTYNDWLALGSLSPDLQEFGVLRGNLLNGCDPELWYELRSQQWQTSSIYDNAAVDPPWLKDIVNHNMLAKDNAIASKQNPFFSNMESPAGQGVVDASWGVSSLPGPARESLVMLAPINSKFRTSRFRFASEIMIKVKHFMFKITHFVRKSI